MCLGVGENEARCGKMWGGVGKCVGGVEGSENRCGGKVRRSGGEVKRGVEEKAYVGLCGGGEEKWGSCGKVC